MIKLWRAWGLVVFLCAVGAIAPAAAQQTRSLDQIEFKSLFIEVSDRDSNFTVVDARFDETGTAGVFFGIVGAGLNSAQNAAQDDDKADTLRAAADKIDLTAILSDALRETLASRGDIALAAGRAEASHTLLVEIRNWGLLRKNREDAQMRVFLNLTLTVLDAKNRTVWEKKRENAVGDEAAPFEAYTDEKLTAEMEKLARKSGQYVAYQFIYR